MNINDFAKQVNFFCYRVKHDFINRTGFEPREDNDFAFMFLSWVMAMWADYSFARKASQMKLKYRMAIEIAVLISKPKNLPLHQHMDSLKTKINKNDMDYDSDVTVCSDDILMEDEEVSTVNVEVEKANLSPNILEGFHLEEFVEENIGDKDLDAQVAIMDEKPPEKEVDEVTRNPTQSTYCESQSQNLLNDLELLRSSLTFCETETDTDKKDTTKANIVTHKQIPIKNNNKNITDPTTSNKPNTYEDSQKTQLYTIPGLYDEFTHVSETQGDFLKIKTNHLYNKSINSVLTKENEANNPEIYYHSINAFEKDKYTNVYKDNTEVASSETETRNESDKNKIDVNKSLHEKIDKNIEFLISQNKIFNDSHKTQSNNISDKSVNDVNSNFDFPMPNFINNNKNKNFTINEKDCNNSDQHQIDKEDDMMVEEDPEAEVIPFKIIKELNNVKCYLNGRDRILGDGYVTDSGYRSDSLSRSSNRSLQSSDWINQSALYLLKFIMDCPVVLKTRDISVEISWALGQLIDKLHDEEKYPSFLEEILEDVDKLLKDIYEGDTYIDDVILKKDVDIHRLFNLNRSHHVIKYTIDKITQLLESFLSRITEDSTLEITDTIHMENLCYIFQILGYLIKKLANTKDNFSQNSTQITQDEDRLKRSSLTDVWRKKWNPNYKSEYQQIEPKKNSETKCSEILNKIIVKAMDGYSLISFAALQCYNLLQS